MMMTGKTMQAVLVFWVCQVLLLNTQAAAESCHYNDTYSCELKSCESCDESIGCVLSPGFCLIRGSCVEDGHIFKQPNGLSFCQICDTTRSTTAYSAALSGTWCNDNIFCNGEDRCTYDATTQISSCNVHFGDPCANNGICNNTCKEADPFLHTPASCTTPGQGIQCANSTACASFTCSAGQCAMKPFLDATPCGESLECSAFTCESGLCVQVKAEQGKPCGFNDTCTADSCNNGICESFWKPDGTLCGDAEYCYEEVCAGGRCVTREPNPLPNCALCPCKNNMYFCDESSGMCLENLSEGGSSSSLRMESIFVLTGICFMVLMCVGAGIWAAMVRYRRGTPPNIYRLAEIQYESDLEHIEPLVSTTIYYKEGDHITRCTDKQL